MQVLGPWPGQSLEQIRVAFLADQKIALIGAKIAPSAKISLKSSVRVEDDCGVGSTDLPLLQ